MDPNLKKGVKRNGLPLKLNDVMFVCQGENAKLMTKEEDLWNCASHHASVSIVSI